MPLHESSRVTLNDEDGDSENHPNQFANGSRANASLFSTNGFLFAGGLSNENKDVKASKPANFTPPFGPTPFHKVQPPTSTFSPFSSSYSSSPPSLPAPSLGPAFPSSCSPDSSSSLSSSSPCSSAQSSVKRPLVSSSFLAPPPISSPSSLPPPLSVANTANPVRGGKTKRVKWGSLINNLLAAVAQQAPGEDTKGGESPAVLDSPALLASSEPITAELPALVGNQATNTPKKRKYVYQNPPLSREMQLMRLVTNPQFWNTGWSVRTDCCNPIFLQNHPKPFRRADELVSFHVHTSESVMASVSVWVQNPLRERRVLLEGEWALPTSLHVDLNKRASDGIDRFFAVCVKSKRRTERAFTLGVTVACPEGQCSFSVRVEVRTSWKTATSSYPSASASEPVSATVSDQEIKEKDAASGNTSALDKDASANTVLEAKLPPEDISKRVPLSCHQCKSCHIYFANCTGVLRRNRKCKKRFCYRCIHKYKDLYNELPSTTLPDDPAPGSSAPTWMCPSCRGICICMACRRRRYWEQNGEVPPTRQSTAGLSSLAAAAAAVMPVAGKEEDEGDSEEETLEEEDEDVPCINSGSSEPGEFPPFDEEEPDSTEEASPVAGESTPPAMVPSELHEHADWEECHCYADLYDPELGSKATEEFMMEAGLPLLDQYLCEAFTAAAVTALAKTQAGWPKGKRFRGQLDPLLGGAMTEAALFESVASAELGDFDPFPRKYEEKPHKSQEKTVLKQLFTPKLVNALENKGLKSALMRLGLQIPKNKAMMKEILLRVGKTGTRDGEVKARPRGRPMGSFKQAPVRKAKWANPLGDSPTSA